MDVRMTDTTTTTVTKGGGRRFFSHQELADKHSELSERAFFGTMTTQYESGRPVLLRFEETVKPK